MQKSTKSRKRADVGFDVQQALALQLLVAPGRPCVQPYGSGVALPVWKARLGGSTGQPDVVVGSLACGMALELPTCHSMRGTFLAQEWDAPRSSPWGARGSCSSAEFCIGVGRLRQLTLLVAWFWGKESRQEVCSWGYVFHTGHSCREMSNGFCNGFLKRFCSWPPKCLEAVHSTDWEPMGRNCLSVAHLNIAASWTSFCCVEKVLAKACVSPSTSLSCSWCSKPLLSPYWPLEIPSASPVPARKFQVQVTFEKWNLSHTFGPIWLVKSIPLSPLFPPNLCFSHRITPMNNSFWSYSSIKFFSASCS